MNEFPGTLVHGSGVVLTLDASRLVFACTEDLTPDDLDSLLTEVDLAIDFGADLPPLLDAPVGQLRIANSPRRFWVQDTSGAPIDQLRFDTLREGLSSVLDWIDHNDVARDDLLELLVRALEKIVVELTPQNPMSAGVSSA